MKRREMMTLLAGGLAAGAGAAPALAGGKPTKATDKRKAGGEGSGGLKRDSDINQKGGAKRAAPASKGGPKAKGRWGKLHIDNRTSLYIRIYLDGNYEGTVGPYGDLWWDIESASWVIEGRAYYPDGTFDRFGPRNIYVPGGGTYTWTLVD